MEVSGYLLKIATEFFHKSVEVGNNKSHSPGFLSSADSCRIFCRSWCMAAYSFIAILSVKIRLVVWMNDCNNLCLYVLEHSHFFFLLEF